MAIDLVDAATTEAVGLIVGLSVDKNGLGALVVATGAEVDVGAGVETGASVEVGAVEGAPVMVGASVVGAPVVGTVVGADVVGHDPLFPGKC
mmetsp:Transcript_15375/g.24847  ORF Transcript_15375/g.24847 Transcript_15375/m.24847 type:complete len:92 (-) Transcript_15375:1204-1479(-)